MKGGGNRLPASIKEARGTLRRDRENPHAPKVSRSDVPAPPPDLAPAESAVWCRLALEVGDLGVYAPSFATSFRQLVRLVSLSESADPVTMPPSAYARLVQVTASALASWGLTPASASRVSAAPSRDSSYLDEFLTYPGKPRLVHTK